jgi:hypothetical protein
MLRQKCNGVGELLTLRDIVCGGKIAGDLAVISAEGGEGDVDGNANTVGADIVPVGFCGGPVTEQREKRLKADGRNSGIAAGLTHHALAQLFWVVEVDE